MKVEVSKVDGNLHLPFPIIDVILSFMSNTELNTGLALVNLASAQVDKRITMKSTGVKGADFLAIDGRSMFCTFSLPGGKVLRLYATIEGGFIVFKGGLYGDHSIATNSTISPAERVESHWRGYVQATEDKIAGKR